MRLDRQTRRILGCKSGKNYLSEARAIEVEAQRRSKPPIHIDKHPLLLEILKAMQAEKITPKQARDLVDRL